MSPRRRITDHYGYCTERAYDPERDVFADLPVAHPLLADPRDADDGLAADVRERVADLPVAHPLLADPRDADDGLTADVRRVLATTGARIRAAHASHLGYPYNLVGRDPAPGFAGHLVNNLGDPYAGSHFASEVCGLEREAVAWLMDLWECDAPDAFWGSVGASGTEGNLWALYLAREAFPQARLLYSAETHYSIPKAARILRLAATEVACTTDGAIDLEAFANALAAGDGGPVIVALTCGTTVKGAHDDVAGVVARLDAAGFGPGRRFVHLDGALNAMVLPFVDEAPASIRPSFRHGIDSISTSGHKMIGTPMPCGALVARRAHVERIASAVAYLRSNDTTLMGSRNGHAVLAIWSRLIGHGAAGFRADARACLARADALAAGLRDAGVPVLRNPHALTVVFPEPAAPIVQAYQLACSRGEAHAIVMPSVTDALLARFRDDYLGWWSSGARQERWAAE